MAAAVGTPSVVIFGPGRPEQWGPLDGRRHHVVDAWALASKSVDPVEALRQLPLEPVLEACIAALKPLAGHGARRPTCEVGPRPSVAHH
jgi:ADP-heptose:LPS heptosyltransferase